MPANYTGNPAGPFNVTDIPLAVDDDEPDAQLIHGPVEQCLDNDAVLNARTFEGSPLAHRSFLFATDENPREPGEYLFLGATDGTVGEETDEYGCHVEPVGITATGGGEGVHLEGGPGGGVRGVWRISGHLVVRVDDATNPTDAHLVLFSSPTTSFSPPGAALASFIETRYSANAAGLFDFDFSYEFFHDSTADLYLAIAVDSGASGDHYVIGAGRLSVTQLSRVLA